MLTLMMMLVLTLLFTAILARPGQSKPRQQAMSTSRHLSTASGSSMSMPMASQGPSAMSKPSASMAGYTVRGGVVGRLTPPEMERPVPYVEDVSALQVSSAGWCYQARAHLCGVCVEPNYMLAVCLARSPARCCHHSVLPQPRKLRSVSHLAVNTTSAVSRCVHLSFFFRFFFFNPA